MTRLTLILTIRPHDAIIINEDKQQSAMSEVDLKSKVGCFLLKSPQLVLGTSRRLEVDLGSLLYQVGSDWHIKVTPTSKCIVNHKQINRQSNRSFSYDYTMLFLTFRKGMGTNDAIGTLRVLTERSIQNGQDVYICFVDYEKVFDRVEWRRLLHALRRMGIDWRDRRLIGNLYMGQQMRVRIDGEYS